MHNRFSGGRLRRTILSFFLYAALCLLCASVLIGGIFCSPARILGAFTEKTYIGAFYADVHGFLQDLCLESNLPVSVADDALPQADLQRLQGAFVEEALSAKPETTAGYEKQLSVLINTLHGIVEKAAPQASETARNRFCKDFEAYLRQAVEFPYMADVGRFTARVQLVCRITAAVSAVLLAGFIYWLKKTEGRLAAVCMLDALWAGGVTFGLTAAAASILNANKSLFVYPAYVSEMAARYAGSCIRFIALLATLLLCAALIWTLLRARLKKNQ